MSDAIGEHALAESPPTIVINLGVNEVLHASDRTQRSMLIALSVAEINPVSDTPGGGGHPVVAEVLAATDRIAIGVDGTWRLAILENNAITDSFSVTNKKPFTVRETLTPVDHFSAGLNGAYALAVTDKLSPVTFNLSNNKASPAVNETLTIIDSVNASTNGVWRLSVLETLSAIEFINDAQVFADPGIYFWNYKWAFGITDTLAVKCAGLDLGDWPVSPEGYVYVPWRSDPDGLFTPTYLINLSNNPPLGGFGPHAANIDIATTVNDLVRVTVDLAIGFPYKSQLQTLRPNAQDQNHSNFGASIGETRRLHQYAIQVVNSQGLSVGTSEDNMYPVIFTDARGDKYPVSQLQTKIHWDVIDDNYSFDGMLLVEMDRVYPGTIVGLIGFMRTMDRSENNK